MAARVFYGWWIVAACLVIAVLSWGLGIFGVGVSIYAITQTRGLSVGAVSMAFTVSAVLSAIATFFVGSLIDRYGPRPVMALGAIVMATGLALIGQVQTLWHVYGAFLLSGSWQCVFVSAGNHRSHLAVVREISRPRNVVGDARRISWRHDVDADLDFRCREDRLSCDHAFGRGTTASCSAAAGVLRAEKNPAQLGLYPDGELPQAKAERAPPRSFSRAEAIRTAAFVTLVVAFSLGLGVQVGFLTHHVTLSVPLLGASGAAFIVSITAITAFLGRVALARWADQVDLRVTAAIVLCVAAISLEAMAAFPFAWVLIAASVVYGLTTGNVTSLSPIIVRREFGAGAFGAINGAAWMVIGIACAFGPMLFGWLYDWFGGYIVALHIAAALDLIAAAAVYAGRPKRALS